MVVCLETRQDTPGVTNPPPPLVKSTYLQNPPFITYYFASSLLLTQFSPTRPSWSCSRNVRVFVCLSPSHAIFCAVGLVQSVPHPWTSAILISISRRALKRGCVPEFDLNLKQSPKNKDVFLSSISISSRALKRGCVPEFNLDLDLDLDLEQNPKNKDVFRSSISISISVLISSRALKTGMCSGILSQHRLRVEP